MKNYFQKIFLTILIPTQIWGTSVNGKKNFEASGPGQIWQTVTGRIDENICKLRLLCM